MVTIDRKRSLIVVDLDGTILEEDFATLNKLNKLILKKLCDLGHKVCIATGRNYFSALPIYQEIGLNSLLATYNGAYINNPSNPNEKSMYKCIPYEIVKDILEEELIKNSLLNALVDRDDFSIICTSDDAYYQQVFFNKNPFIKVKLDKIIESLQKKSCFQLVMEFENDLIKVNNVISILNRKYHSSIVFIYGEKLEEKKKGDIILVKSDKRIIVKIRNSNASKGEAIKWFASQYNIALDNRVAFGNDVNDLEMMKEVEGSVAMINGVNHLKGKSKYITTNLDKYCEGVAEYLRERFDLN